MKTRFTLFSATIFMVMAFSFNAHAQSYLSFNGTEPTTIIAGNNHRVSINYTKPSGARVNIQLRLVSDSGRILREWTEVNTASGSSGTELFLNIQIPLASSNDLNGSSWHTQMFNSNWTNKLAQASSESNRISIAPGRLLPLIPGSSGLVNVVYTKTDAGRANIQVRLLRNGSLVSEVTQRSSNNPGQGRLSFRLPIPSNLPINGNNYSINLQMFNSNWSNLLATSTFGVGLAGGIPLQAELPTESDTEEAVFEGVVASPNPFTNSFHYDYNVTQDDVVSVYLYTLNGQIVKTIQNSEEHSPGSYSDYIDASDLNAGVYILRVTSGEGDTSLKLIKN